MVTDKIGQSCYSVADLDRMLADATAQYSKAHRRARRLDALDRGRLWEELRANMPSYQLLPQTNHVSYIKSNVLCNVYTVGKQATLMYTSEKDKDYISQLNVALEHIWDSRNVSKYQFMAGERAALLNLGVTQVGWDSSIISGEAGSDNFEKGQVVLKNIDPLKYYRDPYADSIGNAQFVVTWDEYHESILEQHYKQAFKKFKSDKNNHTGNWAASEVQYLTDKVSSTACGKEGYHRIYFWFIREGKKIHEIHVIDGRTVLFYRDAIKPNMMPFAELYCNLPAGDLIGTSEPAKIADNSIVYNIMSSIYATSEYKNQRPPRFINQASGININAFVKHGNDADKTFVVNGDARQAVHYQQYPSPSPVGMQTMQQLQNDMQLVTGIDGRYTGRDTGSVITTGGVDSMLDQVSIIDAAKITLYEDYAKTLSELIIRNYIVNSGISRKYLVKDANHIDTYNMVEVPFGKIPDDLLISYNVNISSELPKNKARFAATADAMMEKQMQYQGAGIDVDLITPQEWLMFQDIPHKEYFTERMGLQRSNNWNSLVAQIVTQYSALMDEGVNSANAMTMVADTMKQQSAPGQAVDMQQVAAQNSIF